jgi:hypothetical protein
MELTAYELEEQIRRVTQSATENYNKAYEKEQQASDRRTLLHEKERAVHESRAAAGNPLSKILLQHPKRFETAADTRVTNDPIWRALVADNQFYTRKADLDNTMLQNLMAMRERMTGAN